MILDFLKKGYEIKVDCPNCDVKQFVRIPYGTKKEEGLLDAKCIECKCGGVTLIKRRPS